MALGKGRGFEVCDWESPGMSVPGVDEEVGGVATLGSPEVAELGVTVVLRILVKTKGNYQPKDVTSVDTRNPF